MITVLPCYRRLVRLERRPVSLLTVRSEKQPLGEKPRTFVDAARRAQLVQCTIEAIDELGYRRASLAEIARRAGITKGAIFYHFTNREELLDAVLAEVLQRGAQHILPRVGAADGPAEELRTYIRAFTDSLRVDPQVIRVLVAIGPHLTDEDGRPKVAHDVAMQEAALAPIEDILRRGQDTGQFGPFTVRTMALTIRAALETLPERLTTWPDLDLQRYAEDLVTLFDRATAP